MDEESDSDNLAVVLSVIEGTGFNSRKHAIVAKASLSGSFLETDPAVPGDLTTVFKNNLIWSTNKEAIKRMKEDNQPIKLEFFMQFSDDNQMSVGFVLLPIRCIPFWTSRKSCTMKPHWYKLYAVSNEMPVHKPEVLLSVSIGDKDEILQENFTTLTPSPRKQNAEEVAMESSSDIDLLKSTAEFNVQRIENDCIEINGIEKCEQREFAVKIYLKYIELASEDDKMLLIYKVFKSMPKEVIKDAEKGYFIANETLHLKFKSSLRHLLAYFHDVFYIPIEIIQNNQIAATTNLVFTDSLKVLPESINDFEQIFAANDLTHQFDDCIPLNTSTRDGASNLHYRFSLKLIPEKRATTAVRDDVIISNLQMPLSIPTIRIDENYEEEATNLIPKTFSYNLSLMDCTFNRRPFPGIWQLSLQHPDADIPLVIRNLEISDIVIDQLSFEDMHLRLCFSTYPNQLFDLIKAKTCLLTLKGPRGIHATAELDNQNILSQEKTKGIVLLENDQNEQIAMAHICVEVTELGVNFNAQSNLSAKRQQKNYQTIDFALNEDLAYKKIEELEEWKQVQQKEFLMELKRQEIDHLTRLSNQWQRKRTEQEQNLQKKMDHCSWLTRTLEEAHAAFKERSRTDSEYEQKLLQTKTDLERGFARKIDVLNGKIKQMESDQILQRQRDVNHLMEMEAERNSLKIENEKLKCKIRTLEKELQSQEVSTSTKDQINDLTDYIKMLTTELEETRKSKQQYKERWAKMVREVQKIKQRNVDCGDSRFDEYFRLNVMIDSARTDMSND